MVMRKEDLQLIALLLILAGILVMIYALSQSAVVIEISISFSPLFFLGLVLLIVGIQLLINSKLLRSKH